MMFERRHYRATCRRSVACALAAALLAHGSAAAQTIEQILREMETAQVAAPASAVDERYQPDQIDAATPQGVRENSPPTESTPRPESRVFPASEFESYVSEIVDKPLRRFGAKLLTPGARDFTTPPTMTVPPDYRLNPGDELIIGLTGTVQASNLRVTIDPEGRVFIPRVGAVNVGGVRYGDVEAVIAAEVSRQYRDFHLAVSIGRLHGVTVYVTGYAVAPGSYTVSSLSTLVNAVLGAGGPSAGGSFRSIRVYRDSRLLSDFDLYDLLLKGDKSADVVLQNDDVIYIAPIGAQAAVIGSVNVEAIFETHTDDTLNDVLAYAGGVNTVADGSRVLLLDPLQPGGWRQFTPADAEARVASRGQILRVLSGVGIAQPTLSQSALVTISGEVARPGRYYMEPGASLGAVIEQAGGLTAQSYAFGTVFTRESIRRQQEVSYERALQDVRLTLTAQPLVSRQRRNQNEGVWLAAIQSVVSQLEASRPEGRLVLDVAENSTTLPETLPVENNDTIYIPPRPGTVGVYGSVARPATFQYSPDMRIGDFVALAGGVRKFGDRSEIFVVRANGMLLAPHHGKSRGNILRQRALPGDLVFVPIATDRGEFWARLNDLSSLAFQGGLAAATVVAVTK